MTEFDIGSYLIEQAAAGEHPSEGDLTLDKDKAARKLAKFALPDDYSWVLKFVQSHLRRRLEKDWRRFVRARWKELLSQPAA